MPFYTPAPSCQIEKLGEHYEALFGCRRDGVFVEVGAFDGETCSNTSCLADLGWTGVYVEPVRAYAEACARRHAGNPRVRVANCAIGPGGGTIDVHVGGVLTTTRPDHVAMYQSIEWARGFHRGETVRVQRERLDQLLDSAGIAPGFELLVVDVEGAEADVLDTIDLKAYQPQVLIVEISDEHPSFAPYSDIVEESRRVRSRIEASGYRAYHRDPVNTIFVRLDRPSP